MIYICILAKELSKENEEFILTYDNEDADIQVFTDVLSIPLPPGRVRLLIEELTMTGDAACVITDMENQYRYISFLYGHMLKEVILCPDCCSDDKIDCYEQLMKCDDHMLFFMDQLSLLRNRMAAAKQNYLQSGSRNLMPYMTEGIGIVDLIKELVLKQDTARRKAYLQWMSEYADVLEDRDCDFRIFCLSALLNFTKENCYAELLCREIRRSCYEPGSAFFIYHQLKRFYLKNGDVPVSIELEKLYQEILTGYREVFEELLVPIPEEQKISNRVAVIALQVLGGNHAPTKTAMERLYTLQHLLQKDVFCIHSKEQLTTKDALPFYDGMLGNVEEAYNGEHRLHYKDAGFIMYQPSVAMPDLQEFMKLIGKIRDFAPEQIVVLGDHCLLGDVCSSLAPTVCIPMTFSSLPMKSRQFVAVGRKLTDADRERIRGYQELIGECSEEQFIESTFTFELIPKTTTLSRKELKLPEDAFVVSVVGIRLDAEVSEEFVQKLLPLLQEGIHIAFAGYFERYESLCETYEELRQHSTFVGYQKDIQAFQEVCDLYVNPPRVGGGFSVVEAFHMKKPGVTLPWGDVAAAAGEEFFAADLDEMVELIRRYKNDAEFYRTMSEKAYARSLELFDSKSAMEHILEEVKTRWEKGVLNR